MRFRLAYMYETICTDHNQSSVAVDFQQLYSIEGAKVNRSIYLYFVDNRDMVYDSRRAYRPTKYYPT